MKWAAASIVALLVTGWTQPASHSGVTTTYPTTSPAVVAVGVLRFSQDENESYDFRFSDADEPYLVRLRTEYKLDEVVAGAGDDYAKVRAVSRWVRTRWRHGQNQPRHSDPISILQEATAGKRFRCVEYSIVTSGALTALGIRSRVLALKTADVETRESGAGHVVVEAFLPDLRRWIMIDGQWDVIPVLDDKPLNAVEFQRALAERPRGLGVHSFSADVDPARYFEWVGKYLFYFDVRFDQRFGRPRDDGGLMLVPLGAEPPTVFQRSSPIRGMSCTHCERAFYAPPQEPRGDKVIR